MYHVKQARSYRNGANTSRSGSRSYFSLLGMQDMFRVATTEDMVRAMKAVIDNTNSKVRLSGEVVAEKVIQLGRELETNPRAKSKFARILEAMRKAKANIGNGSSNGKGRKRISHKGNPPKGDESEDLEDITTMSEDFHGRDTIDQMDVVEDIEYQDRLAILADLLELGILSTDESKIINICFNTPKDRPKLTCDATGDNLQLVGGDQELDLDPEDYGGKEVIPVGYCVMIAYETDKHHLQGSNGKVEGYEHYFGEEFYKEQGYAGNKFFDKALSHGVVAEAKREGYLPMVLYDYRNGRILFAGGRYRVEDVGIRD